MRWRPGDHEQRDRGPEPTSDRGGTPGKRTLTGSLSGPIQRKAAERERARPPGGPRSLAEQGIVGSGREVPYRPEMEAAFGVSFAAVQAHTDAPAQQACGDLGARAYTMGSHVAFADPAPDRELVAHELTHVVQQAGPGRLPAEMGRAGDAHEQEADAAAARVAGGAQAGVAADDVGAVAQGPVQRAEAEPAAEKPQQGPQLLLQGEAALRFGITNLQLTPRTVPSPLGPITLRPGIPMGDNIIVTVSPTTVRWLEGNRLYEDWTESFVRDYYLQAFAAGGARAEAWIAIADTEIAFLEGLAAPWYVLAGVSLARIIAIYVEHREAIHALIDSLGIIALALEELDRQAPQLFDALLARWSAELMGAISSEDIAFLIGRIMKGVGGLTEITLRTFALEVLKVTAIVSALHFPAVAARAGKAAYEKEAAVVRSRLAEIGVSVDQTVALAVAGELSIPEVRARLDELGRALQHASPFLQELANALRGH